MSPRAVCQSFAALFAMVPCSTLAEQLQAPFNCTAIQSNRAPGFEHDYSYTAHPERRLLVSFDASDPDGDRLHYTAIDLPQGASFDEQLGRLDWTPSADQIGRHVVRVTVSDGRAEAKTTLFLRVDYNHAPIGLKSHYVTFSGSDFSGSRERNLELAADGDGDSLTVQLLTVPPRGASVHADGNRVVLDWSPSENDVGDHSLICEVSDGQVSTILHSTITVTPAPYSREWARALLLGGGIASFVTHRDGETLLGGEFDVTFFADRRSWLHGFQCKQNPSRDDCHASHRRFYGQFEILHSLRSNASALFAYGLGFSASFEWYPSRRALIPLYGVEVGGLYRGELGHRAATRPYLGAHLWASDTLWVTATLGYRVVPADLREFSGPTCSLTAMISPW